MGKFFLTGSCREEVIDLDGKKLKYIFKQSKYDTKHLIIVFSGFGGKSQFTYDFKKSLDSNRSNIIWIKDDFLDKKNACYYIDPIHKKKYTRIEETVISFIHKALDYLNLEKEQCTLLGCSKGGASALYYGLKYDFNNLVISAPTLLIGSYIAGLIPSFHRVRANFTAMFNAEKGIESYVKKYDDYIIEKLRKDKFLRKNIYLFTSQVDPIHENHIKPFIHEFLKYDNFNYLESVSPLVRMHQDVTSYNAPLIISILNSLSYNLPPYYTKTVLNEEVVDLTKIRLSAASEVVFDLQELYLEASTLFISGVYFIRYLECKNYSDLDYSLILNQDGVKRRLKLAKDNRPILSKNYYKDYFVNYDKSYFCTNGYKGLDLQDIDPGKYLLSLIIEMKTGESDEKILVSLTSKSLVSHSNGRRYELISESNSIYLCVS